MGCLPGQTVPGGVLLERTGSYDRGVRHDPCALRLGLAYQGRGGTELDENNNFMNSLAGLFVRMPHSWSGTAGRAVSGVARLLAACLLLASFPLHAAVIVVSSVSDGLVFGDGCSLREALVNANTDSLAGSLECEAGVGADVIVLPAATIYLAGNLLEEADAATGDLDVTSDVTILGGLPWSVIDGQSRGRFFDIAPGARFTLRGATLQRGTAASAGGALRVGAGASALLDETRLMLSSISSAAVGGRGGAIFAASGSEVTVRRSEISSNQAIGTNGSGAGIYCDGCSLLELSRVTLSNNNAAGEGGSLYVSAAGTARLEFVTIAQSQAPVGAGAYVAGTVDLLGSLFGDNGVQVAGNDLYCAAGSVLLAQDSFAEYPGGCPGFAVSGLLQRSDIPVNGDLFFYHLGTSRYSSLPSSIQMPLEYWYPWIADVVPAVDCPVDGDQHGRRGPSGGACDMGAAAAPLFGASPMALPIDLYSSPASVYLGLQRAPDRQTTVRLFRRDNGSGFLGGIGESCAYPDQLFTFEAGQNQVIWNVDPQLMFTSLDPMRRNRVCEFDVVVESGDPTLVGARAGTLRVNVRDTSANLASGISSPAYGQYLEFGTAPYGSGLVRPITFYNRTGAAWSVTGATIDGEDASRFERVTDLPLEIPASGSRDLGFRCKGGQFGTFAARVTLTTTHPQLPSLVYGLRCTVAHQVSIVTVTDTVDESADGAVLGFMLTLDAPNAAGPFTVELVDGPGTATPLEDYEPAARTVTFDTGVQALPVELAVYDDDRIEVTETVTVHVLGTSTGSVVPSTSVAVASIKDDDIAHSGGALDIHFVDDFAGEIPAGARYEVMVRLANTGSTVLQDPALSLTVSAPMRIQSFVDPRASSCGIVDNGLTASCSFTNTRVLPGEQITVSALVLFAEINEPPELDVRTFMSATATATSHADPDGEGPLPVITGRLLVEDELQLVIKGVGVSGGGSLSLPLLFLLALVALRGGRAVGSSGVRGLGRGSGKCV